MSWIHPLKHQNRRSSGPLCRAVWPLTSFTSCVHRVYADGKVEYLHPKDGVYPEKVNAGRVGVNQNMRSIGENVDPIKVGLRLGWKRAPCSWMHSSR
eukprot:scaffold317188_cov19-Tisochrysis_lutea.AAC.1